MTTPSLSWKKKLIFGSAVTLGFFLLTEGILALVGVRPATQREDPTFGFSRQVPLLEATTDGDGNLIMVTAAGKEVWFNSQSFPQQKTAGTRRVFCVGGSTTHGRPFADATSYVAWLRELLPEVDPSTRWEVINAGGVSYASYRVAAVMEELAQYEPDLFVVYSVHNEFLERRTYAEMFENPPWTRELSTALQRTRIGSLVTRIVSGATRDASEKSPTPVADQLPEEVDEMLNHSIGPLDYHRDDAWQAGVVQHYRQNLTRMVSIARQAGAQIVFITPASNLRDCTPFKSESETPADDRSELVRSLRTARDQLERSQFDKALATVQPILASDSRNAEAQFLVGRALFGMKRWKDAESAFQVAIDEDVCPLRAVTGIERAVHEVAKQLDVPLVDFHALLRKHSLAQRGHACFGDEYFLDHVHPTLDVHRDLGVWIVEELQRNSLVAGDSPSEALIAEVARRIESQIDPESHAVAFRNLAKVFHWAGKFDEAARRARDAILLMPLDLESLFLLADCLSNTNKPDEAYAAYQDLFAAGDYPRAYLPYAELLVERGQLEEAESYLMPALLTKNVEHQARAYYNLGLIHYALRNDTLAMDALIEVDLLYPNDPATLTMLAETYGRLGKRQEAIDTLRRLIEIDAEDQEAKASLEKWLSDETPLEESVISG